MHTADDRLEVVDAERPRKEVAVPSGNVERMVIEHDLVDAVVLLHVERKISHLIVRLDENRAADVALGVRRAFDQLAELVPIALRPADVSAALEDEQLRLVALFREAIAMENSAVDDEIIARRELEIAEDRLEN